MGTELFVSRVFTLRREGQQEIRGQVFRVFDLRFLDRVGRGGAAQPGLLENLKHDFVGGPRVGGAFQDDQLVGPQGGADLLRRVADEAEIGLTMLVERRGDADDDDVHVAQAVEIVGDAEVELDDRFRNLRGGNVADISFPSLQLLDLFGIDVEAGDLESGAGKTQRQRQADVAHAHDSDLRRLFLQSCEQGTVSFDRPFRLFDGCHFYRPRRVFGQQ